MARGKNRIDNRGLLQRLYDDGIVANDQEHLNVLPSAQLTMRVDVSAGYGPERRLYAPVDKGRRYFRLQHLDRLHRNGKLTYEQHAAGAWYRARWDAGRYDQPRTADYTKVRGENVVTFDLPVNAQQARDQWHAARSAISKNLVGMVDQLVIRDHWPRANHHHGRKSNLAILIEGLNELALHLKL